MYHIKLNEPFERIVDLLIIFTYKFKNTRNGNKLNKLWKKKTLPSFKQQHKNAIN